MKPQNFHWASLAVLPLAALALGGCWTPPNANVQPEGEPRLIQSGIRVESVKDPATVEAVNRDVGTITLKLADGATRTYKVASQAKHFDQVGVGDQVSATIADELAVYLLANGRLPDGSTAQSLGVNARVLLVDPSYRLLTLQYPNGTQATFKPGLGIRLLEMAPGDGVVVSPVEVVKIRIEKP